MPEAEVLEDECRIAAEEDAAVESECETLAEGEPMSDDDCEPEWLTLAPVEYDDDDEELDNPYHCVFCPYSSNRRANVARHVGNKHGKNSAESRKCVISKYKESYACAVCTPPYETNNDRTCKIHIQKVHGIAYDEASDYMKRKRNDLDASSGASEKVFIDERNGEIAAFANNSEKNFSAAKSEKTKMEGFSCSRCSFHSANFSDTKDHRCAGNRDSPTEKHNMVGSQRSFRACKLCGFTSPSTLGANKHIRDSHKSVSVKDFHKFISVVH